MRFFNAHGRIDIAEKQGKPQKEKDVSKKNKNIAVCLNCDELKCNGNCEKFKKRLHRNKNKNREEISK